MVQRKGLVVGTFPPGLIIDTNTLARASLSVQCTDNKVCTDDFGTDSESDKGGLVIRTVPILCLQVLNFPLTFPLTKIIPPYLNLQKKNNNYVFENLICFVRML